MDAELTKGFSFSASYRSGDRSIGRNYILRVTVHALPESEENEFEKTVQNELIEKIHTRDLSDNVDFLKNTAIDDLALLRAFRKRLAASLARFQPKRLTLERDARTETTIQW